MSISSSSLNRELDVMRHTFAHLMAAAVKQMFPEAQFGVGPVVKDGCYYDFVLPRTLIPEDLPLIEKKIKNLLQRNLRIKVQEYTLEDALQLFAEMNQPLKIELLESLALKGTTNIKAEEQEVIQVQDGQLKITVYRLEDETTGEDLFVDLCKGPHVADFKAMRKLGFKLDKFSGSYWRGDQERNLQMQRIYALVYENREELEAFVGKRKEALARDHRKLGKELDLFAFSELVGAGLPMWTTKGTVLREKLNDFVWNLRQAKGYQKVTIPHVTKKELYEASGHWSKFSDELYKIHTRDGRQLVMKPMNCPHHTQIFASRQRSYRDMPQRYAETTMVYRDEQTGELSGLSRVLSITQDDAHVFCRSNQIAAEMNAIWDIIDTFYKTFGFELMLRFSRHDPAQIQNYKGDETVWQQAEAQIREIIESRVGDTYNDGLGEAAFYGPKIDFVAKDSLDREWQVATIQLDFNQPEGFDLTCVNESGEQERVVMIHAAIMGSIERFSGVLIEHVAGRFPFWLAPVQVKILTLNDQVLDYVKQIEEILSTIVLMRPVKYNEIRYEIDDRAESVGKKIREASMEKVPVMIIVGNRDVEAHTVNVRTQDSEQTIQLTELKDFIGQL
jgi:threonyl-tRNA synthetase